MENKRKLTFKQKGFVMDFVKTKGNATEAAVRNYNVKSRDVAKVTGCLNLKKPLVIREIERVMEEKNITDELMMDKLKEGLEAKVVSAYKGGSKQTDIPDMNIRHKYLDTSLKVKNLYPAQQIETKNINIDVQLEGKSSQEIKSLLKELLKEYEKGNTKGTDKGTGEEASGDRSGLEIPGKGEDNS